MSNTVAVLQSNYLPWKGYFDIIHDVDVFVFYDDVQYTKNDWRNRNRIKTAGGTAWLSVPVGTRIHRPIYEVEISDRHWAAKHWASIRQSYARAPHFKHYAPFFQEVFLGQSWTNLSQLNQHLIRSIARDCLGIKTRFTDSRKFELSGERGDRLLCLLQQVGARTYVSGPSARSYLDEPRFAQAGIDIRFMSYEGYPEYPQVHPPFEHAVSIIDLLFHLGPSAGEYIWGWRSRVT